MQIASLEINTLEKKKSDLTARLETAERGLADIEVEFETAAFNLSQMDQRVYSAAMSDVTARLEAKKAEVSQLRAALGCATDLIKEGTTAEAVKARKARAKIVEESISDARKRAAKIDKLLASIKDEIEGIHILKVKAIEAAESRALSDQLFGRADLRVAIEMALTRVGFQKYPGLTEIKAVDSLPDPAFALRLAGFALLPLD